MYSHIIKNIRKLGFFTCFHIIKKPIFFIKLETIRLKVSTIEINFKKQHLSILSTWLQDISQLYKNNCQ